MLRRYDLNFYEYEMLTERERYLFFTAFLKTVNSLLRISLISFSQQKNRQIIDGMHSANLEACFLTENWTYRKTVLKRKPLDFAKARPTSLLSSSS